MYWSVCCHCNILFNAAIDYSYCTLIWFFKLLLSIGLLQKHWRKITQFNSNCSINWSRCYFPEKQNAFLFIYTRTHLCKLKIYCIELIKSVSTNADRIWETGRSYCDITRHLVKCKMWIRLRDGKKNPSPVQFFFFLFWNWSINMFIIKLVIVCIGCLKGLIWFWSPPRVSVQTIAVLGT